MAGYQKTIAYLDYLENGMKIKNAGFVRIEENGGRMRLEMRVKNIPESFSGQYELKADAGGTVGRISLSRGCGSCCVVWSEGNEGSRGKRKTQANGIYIRLPGRRLLQAVWPSPIGLLTETQEQGEEKDQIQELRPEAVQFQKETADTEGKARRAEPVKMGQRTESVKVEPKTEPAETEQRMNTVDTEQSAEPIGQGRKAEPTGTPQKGDLQLMEAERGMQENDGCKTAVGTEFAQQEKSVQEAKEPVCYGDKWEQLSHMYMQIHPFQDDRMYLSIAPKDFVVLRQEYQKMVHNSFLLHGYYNYKHLILGKIREKDEWCYYLGVPGNFYNREKMVAEMFGFEAFEGERNPAGPGDFGYFMKKVEI